MMSSYSDAVVIRHPQPGAVAVSSHNSHHITDRKAFTVLTCLPTHMHQLGLEPLPALLVRSQCTLAIRARTVCISMLHDCLGAGCLYVVS